jgi:hypothetical protein
MRIVLLGLGVLFTGCTVDLVSSESVDQSAVTSRTIPMKSGSFVGHYKVPTSAQLAGAALFAVPEARWTIAGGLVTLHYDLPVGLVGGEVEVTLSGAISPGKTVIQLTGVNGSGTCTATNSVVSCSEDLANLGALPISQTVVMQTAAAEYPGPASDRAAVANIFSSDPIGTVDFDINAPSDDDDDDDGGGHGGHGPH